MATRTFVVKNLGLGVAGTSPAFLRYAFVDGTGSAGAAPAIVVVDATNAPGVHRFSHSVAKDVYAVIDMDPGQAVPLTGDLRYLHLVLTPDDDAISEARMLRIHAAVTQGGFRVTVLTKDAAGEMATGTLKLYASGADAQNNVNPIHTANLTATLDDDGDLAGYVGAGG